MDSNTRIDIPECTDGKQRAEMYFSAEEVQENLDEIRGSLVLIYITVGIMVLWNIGITLEMWVMLAQFGHK